MKILALRFKDVLCTVTKVPCLFANTEQAQKTKHSGVGRTPTSSNNLGEPQSCNKGTLHFANHGEVSRNNDRVERQMKETPAKKRGLE